MKNIIEVKNLDFYYGSNLIFTDVNFTIEKGDFISLIGANGSGKSTLLNLILGQVKPSRGSIKILGQDSNDFRDWSRIGYVPQSGFGLDRDFPASCQEIVSTNLYSKIGLFKLPNKKDKKDVLKALSLVGMDQYAKAMFSELSGGQMQRVMIARVLVNNPHIMILDEPTSGIDADTIRLLFDILSQLNRKRNITIIMVTHDTAETLNYSNRYLCLEEGSLLELEKSDIEKELSHRHSHPSIRKFNKRGN